MQEHRRAFYDAMYSIYVGDGEPTPPMVELAGLAIRANGMDLFGVQSWLQRYGLASLRMESDIYFSAERARQRGEAFHLQIEVRPTQSGLTPFAREIPPPAWFGHRDGSGYPPMALDIDTVDVYVSKRWRFNARDMTKSQAMATIWRELNSMLDRELSSAYDAAAALGVPGTGKRHLARDMERLVLRLLFNLNPRAISDYEIGGEYQLPNGIILMRGSAFGNTDSEKGVPGAGSDNDDIWLSDDELDDELPDESLSVTRRMFSIAKSIDSAAQGLGLNNSALSSTPRQTETD